MQISYNTYGTIHSADCNDKRGINFMDAKLQSYLGQALSGHTKKIIISNPKGDASFKKIVIEKKQNDFLVSKYTQKQVFNETVGLCGLQPFCEKFLEGDFKQLNAWDDSTEYMIKRSKKGKCLFHRANTKKPPKTSENHNRKKSYLLPEGEVIPPLVDMGIFTREGMVVRTMYDKFKQINRFIEIIEDAVSKYELEQFNIIDFGCGKSYLTFVVYYYLHEKKGLPVHMTGLDLKTDVIAKCNDTARKYGYTDLEFAVGDINGYHTDREIHMVISLHACDTATDYALFNAICWNAKIIISVPCCQHELCGQLDSAEQPLLQRYGIIKERSASLFTDAIRANLVEACGYKVQLLEFVDLSHTPKNILIRAVKSHVSKEHKMKMVEEVERLTDCFSLEPTLKKLLSQAEMLPKK